MKSIKLLTVAVMVMFFTSCEKGIGVTIGVGGGQQNGQWVQIGSGGGYYYGNNVPTQSNFVLYVRGGSGNPSSVPLFYQNGQYAGINASTATMGGNMVYFFPWLSAQSPNKFVPVVVEGYQSGITNVVNYNIIWAYW